MLHLMLITRDPRFASFAASHGVDRIFVDLEINGKQERQGHRDTVISNHTLEDVAKIRAAVPGQELLVRLNPDHAGSDDEIERVIGLGADIIMLPMFSSLEEVRHFSSVIDGRCNFIPLVETPEAVSLVTSLVKEPGVDEIYIGLNDLHMALGMDFMFQLLTDGTVEKIAGECRAAGKPFGFGGVARMDEGLLKGELVLSEHIRLGSSAVILSRTFHRAEDGLDKITADSNFAQEVARLRESESRLMGRSSKQIDEDHQMLLVKVNEVRDKIRAGRAR